MPTRPDTELAGDTTATQLWLAEHEWLFSVMRSETNVSPAFRFPDLISACVSLVLASPDGPSRIFGFLGSELVLRDPRGQRRREAMWTEQFVLLRDLQRSPANQYPHPNFQLDQLTTACVALCREADMSGANVLQQARVNMANRSGGKTLA